MIVDLENVYCTISNAQVSSIKEINNKLSVFAPGYQYTALYKRRKWNGKVAMFHKSTFLSGLLPLVTASCREAHIQINDRRNGPSTPWGWCSTTVPLRGYQRDAIDAALDNTEYNGLWWPRGVIKIPTGGGKTAIASAMIQMLDVPTIFIVNTKDLLWQAHRVFNGYGIDAGVIGDNNYDIKQTTVSTIQSLYSLLKNDPDKIGFLSDIKQVFFDEAHLIAATVDKGNLFTKIASLIPAQMRWGLTATPFMKDQYSNWLLQGVTGNELYSISNKELIEMGYLAEGRVTMLKVPGDPYIVNKWPECYDEGIVAYPKRNNKIVDLIATKDKPVLVLVQREGHGTLLSNMCQSKGLKVPFIFGDNSSKDRIKAIKDLRKGTIDGVIASTIWDTGVDIPEIRTLILAGGGKSPVRNLQRLGRGLRVAEGKTHLEVYDFYDYSTRWLKQHSQQRKNLWVNEGFDVILKDI